MLSLEAAQERALALLERARRAGADAGDAIYSADASESIQVRLGKLEDVERSESEHIGLRVFRRHALGLDRIERPGRTRRWANWPNAPSPWPAPRPEDQYAGLAPEDRSADQAPVPGDLDLADHDRIQPPGTAGAGRCEAEDAARAVAGVTNSARAAMRERWRSGLFALVTSHGFAGAYARARCRGLSASGGSGRRVRACSATMPGAPRALRRRTCPTPAGDRPAQAGRTHRRGGSIPGRVKQRQDAAGVRSAGWRFAGRASDRGHVGQRRLPGGPASCSTRAGRAAVRAAAIRD